jgi:hypothetical protein
MMVGSLIGGFIEAFLSRERMATFLPRIGIEHAIAPLCISDK